MNELNPLETRFKDNEDARRTKHTLAAVALMLITLLGIVMFVFGDDVQDNLEGTRRISEDSNLKLERYANCLARLFIESQDRKISEVELQKCKIVGEDGKPIVIKNPVDSGKQAAVGGPESVSEAPQTRKTTPGTSENPPSQNPPQRNIVQRITDSVSSSVKTIRDSL